ncbi:hypothetical protein [Streptomyces sp. NPDC004250]|uniref:hypothetical protein n=1 Tax=Streptomyces sp. NPDC004250 TaxID=3364692 RepID=UPI0036CE41EE
MTTTQKTATVFLTVLCGLLLAIAGLTQAWPMWLWATLAVLLVAAPAVTVRTAALRRGPIPATFEEQLTAPPVERTEHRISHVAMPSSWDDYRFVLSATVRWCLTESTGSTAVLNPAGLAVQDVLNRARAITERRKPGDASLVQHELSGALSRMCAEPTGQLQAMAEDITLTLPQQDQERLDRLARVRKDEAVWEHQRKYEQSKRQYLGEDVLKDTGSAVVWWLARNEEHVERTVGDLPLIAQLTSAANDTDIPERLQTLLSQQLPAADLPEQVNPDTEFTPPQQTAADHLLSFFNAIGFSEGDDRLTFVAKQISDIIKQQNRHETAEDLLRRFDPPVTFSPDADNERQPSADAHDEASGSPLT